MTSLSIVACVELLAMSEIGKEREEKQVIEYPISIYLSLNVSRLDDENYVSNLKNNIPKWKTSSTESISG